MTLFIKFLFWFMEFRLFYNWLYLGNLVFFTKEFFYVDFINKIFFFHEIYSFSPNFIWLFLQNLIFFHEDVKMWRWFHEFSTQNLNYKLARYLPPVAFHSFVVNCFTAVLMFFSSCGRWACQGEGRGQRCCVRVGCGVCGCKSRNIEHQNTLTNTSRFVEAHTLSRSDPIRPLTPAMKAERRGGHSAAPVPYAQSSRTGSWRHWQRARGLRHISEAPEKNTVCKRFRKNLFSRNEEHVLPECSSSIAPVHVYTREYRVYACTVLVGTTWSVEEAAVSLEKSNLLVMTAQYISITWTHNSVTQ